MIVTDIFQYILKRTVISQALANTHPLIPEFTATVVKPEAPSSGADASSTVTSFLGVAR